MFLVSFDSPEKVPEGRIALKKKRQYGIGMGSLGYVCVCVCVLFPDGRRFGRRAALPLRGEEMGVFVSGGHRRARRAERKEKKMIRYGRVLRAIPV